MIEKRSNWKFDTRNRSWFDFAHNKFYGLFPGIPGDTPIGMDYNPGFTPVLCLFENAQDAMRFASAIVLRNNSKFKPVLHMNSEFSARPLTVRETSMYPFACLLTRTGIDYDKEER